MRPADRIAAAPNWTYGDVLSIPICFAATLKAVDLSTIYRVYLACCVEAIFWDYQALVYLVYPECFVNNLKLQTLVVLQYPLHPSINFLACQL